MGEYRTEIVVTGETRNGRRIGSSSPVSEETRHSRYVCRSPKVGTRTRRYQGDALYDKNGGGTPAKDNEEGLK